MTFDLHDLCGNYCAVVPLKLRVVEDSHGKHRLVVLKHLNVGVGYPT